MGLGDSDLFVVEAHEGQQIEVRLGHGLGRHPQHIANEAIVKMSGSEGLAQRRSRGEGGLDQAQFVIGEAKPLQRGAADVRGVCQRAFAAQMAMHRLQIGLEALQDAGGGAGQGRQSPVLIFRRADGAGPGLGAQGQATQAQADLSILEQGDRLDVAGLGRTKGGGDLVHRPQRRIANQSQDFRSRGAPAAGAID